VARSRKHVRGMIAQHIKLLNIKLLNITITPHNRSGSSHFGTSFAGRFQPAPYCPSLRALVASAPMAGGRWRVHGSGRGGACICLQIALLLESARAQVRYLRFVDEDSTSGKMGGHIYWDIPATGDDGIDYAAYLATDATGTSKTQLPLGSAHDLPGGAAVSSFPVPMDTAYGSNTHIVVYEKAHGTGTLSNIAAICIVDNPDGFVRTVYATMTGYTKANDARTQYSIIASDSESQKQ
jgi:hypothetical protein